MKDNWGVLIIAGLLGFVLFSMLKSRSINSYPTQYYEPTPEPLRIKPVAQPIGRRYVNSETWDIKWEDGLPSQITIHRDATQT